MGGCLFLCLIYHTIHSFASFELCSIKRKTAPRLSRARSGFFLTNLATHLVGVLHSTYLIYHRILIFASSSAPAPRSATNPRPPKRIAPKSKHHIRCSFKEANISFPAPSRFTMPKPGKLLLHYSGLLYNHHTKDFCGLLQKSFIISHAKIRIKSVVR